MSDFEQAKKNIENTLLSLPGARKKAELSINGNGGFHGGYSYYDLFKSLRRLRADFLDADFQSKTAYRKLVACVVQLFEVSNSEPFGPFYHAEVIFERGEARFEFYWKNDPGLTPVNVRKEGPFGWIPSFMFTRHFNRELVEQATDTEVYYSLESVVYTALEQDLEIHDDLISLYALYDMTTDVHNGWWDQYFRRVTDTWSTGKFSRLEMYRRILSILETLNCLDAKKFFEHAIALYAHVHNHVDEYRRELRIPKVSKESEVEKLDQLKEQFNEWEKVIASYIRTNIDDFEINFRTA